MTNLLGLPLGLGERKLRSYALQTWNGDNRLLL